MSEGIPPPPRAGWRLLADPHQAERALPIAQRWRLGLNLGTTPGSVQSYLGWAALKLDGDRQAGPTYQAAAPDPVEAAIAVWLSGPEPRPEIELFRHEAATFPSSRAAADGATLQEHQRSIADAAERLRAAGATVKIVRATR